MDLREVLGILSKSSPFAVTTTGEIVDPVLRSIKKYLYVETEIEKEFKSAIATLKQDEIIFLCGSSGDGKSEILTRYNEQYGADVIFHLDATHSFNPDETAIETLNAVFARWKLEGKPLVIGINTGMLANYEQDGSDNHSEIKSAIVSFLSQKQPPANFKFINFESFEKFKIVGEAVSAAFFSDLIKKVVRDDQRNPFKSYFEDALGKKYNNDLVLVSNYLMLRDMGVQKVIIELIFSARISEDQFVTTRALLDFIFCILTGKGFLFDNLFAGGENELLQSISKFDPAAKRSKLIDEFVLHRALGFEDQEYKKFVDELQQRYRLLSEVSPLSELRLVYLSKNSLLQNEYPKKFIKEFGSEGEILYREMWELHNIFDGDKDQRKSIKSFYDTVIFPAIAIYANRNAPHLTKDEFYLSSHGGYDLASEIELGVSYNLIQSTSSKDIHVFSLFLEANEERLVPVQINVNLLTLMLEIVCGYRPNKYDKGSVVILDDLVSKIAIQASSADQIYVFEKDERIARIKNGLNGDLRVSGL
jgi:DNA phosphorothioation-dependent restriction protein DptF